MAKRPYRTPYHKARLGGVAKRHKQHLRTKVRLLREDIMISRDMMNWNKAKLAYLKKRGR